MSTVVVLFFLFVCFFPPHSKNGLGSIPGRATGVIFVWSLHVLPVSAWVSSHSATTCSQANWTCSIAPRCEVFKVKSDAA